MHVHRVGDEITAGIRSGPSPQSGPSSEASNHLLRETSRCSEQKHSPNKKELNATACWASSALSPFLLIRLSAQAAKPAASSTTVSTKPISTSWSLNLAVFWVPSFVSGSQLVENISRGGSFMSL